MDVAVKRLRHASEQERTETGKTQELPQVFSFRLLQPDYALIPFRLEGGKVPRSAREMVSPNKRYRERGHERAGF